ncbi:hypothetical protein N7465_007884 [Penicillium sp. CMV-2018d]|nr:hypothetical protein N7465_007884 [Penicillium sp. CMV-2018d]
MVWDKPGADRTRLTHANDFPECFIYAGEIPEHDWLTARGNCLTCNTASIEDIESQLRLTQYFKKVS